MKWNLFASTFLCCYSWLPITQTIANSNLTLTQTKVDFPNTLNVILPSVTRNPDNLYLPLIRSIFFSSDHFYITWPSITQITFLISTWQFENISSVQNNELIWKQPCQFFAFIFLSLQFKFSVHLCILIKLCCLIAFPPYKFDYFIIFSYLPWTPNNSNFFDFPRRFKLSGVDFTCFLEFHTILKIGKYRHFGRKRVFT